jgi:DNA mismatch endonuclease (patch repair protein)
MPDLVFASRKKVGFVHGCFWHDHEIGCADARLPKFNQGYWSPKLKRNKEQDAQNEVLLKAAGWKVLTVWEYELKDSALVRRRLRAFLRK